MPELEPDVRAFSHDRQYRTVGWRVVFETLKRIGQDVEPEEIELENVDFMNWGKVRAAKAVKSLGFIAADNMLSIKRRVIQMSVNKSPYSNFVHQTPLMVISGDELKKVPNTDMLNALSIFYSNKAGAARLKERYKLGRFDSFITEPAGNIVNFSVEKLQSALATEDDEVVLRTFNSVYRDGDLYAGLWDRERMAAPRPIVTIQLPDQPIRRPRSSAQQPPEPPDTLPASA